MLDEITENTKERPRTGRDGFGEENNRRTLTNYQEPDRTYSRRPKEDYIY